MNTWKIRLIVIGFINAIIGIIFGFTREFSLLIIGYICVGLLVGVAGVVWNPKEKTEST